MKLGTVVGVYLSDDTYENFNSITVSLRDRGSKNLLRCTPLDTNSRKIPVIGEQVYVLVGNSDEASGASNSTKNYYLSTVGIQNNVNHNALPKLTKAEGSSVPNFSQVSNGIPIQGSTDNKIDFGIGFVEDSSISQLQPFLGDVIHEGRFGQSMRFGYTPQNTKQSDNKIKGVVNEPSWKSTDPKSPITIIRNGAGESRGYNKFVIEDINKDDSSIWLASKQTIGLTPSNSFTLGVTPTNLYKNPQIVLNSDRIVLNSKSDSVLISGDKSVNVSTPNWKADMDVIFSQLEELKNQVLAINNALIPLGVGLTGIPLTAPLGAPLTQATSQVATKLIQITTQLQLMKQ